MVGSRFFVTALHFSSSCKKVLQDGDVGVRGSRPDRFLYAADYWAVMWDIPVCLQRVADDCPEYGRRNVTGASCHLGSERGWVEEKKKEILFK